MSYEMHFPSAGLCQEVCLASNYFVFGLQVTLSVCQYFTKCVCLEQIPEQRRRGANDCSLSCSVKTNLKFRNDCGGNKTYSLFKSGSKMENSAFTSNECLSIQCPTADNRFIENECKTSYAQVCNNTWYGKYNDWQSLSGECKSNHNSYLLGDVDLTNPMQACALIKEQFLSPSWIGIAKELYLSNNGVINSMENIDKNPMRCMKCNSDNCTLTDCKESNSFVCLKTNTYIHNIWDEGPETTSTSTGTTTSTTPQGTVSTSTTSLGTTTSIYQHGTVFTSTSSTRTTTSTTPQGITTSTTPHGTVSTEHSSNSLFEVKNGPSGSNNTKESMLKKQDGNTTVMMTVVPFTVIIILGLIALLLVILWTRRQTKKTAETKMSNMSLIYPNIPRRVIPITHYKIIILFWRRRNHIQRLIQQKIPKIKIAKALIMHVMMTMIIWKKTALRKTKKIPIIMHSFLAVRTNQIMVSEI